MFTLILDQTLKEMTVQGSRDFPFEIYIGGAAEFDKGYLDWHWHDYFEINYVASGTLHYFIENRKYVLHEGDAIFINAGRLHRGYAQEPTQESCTIVFGGDLFCSDTSSKWYSSLVENYIQSDVNGLALTKGTPWMENILAELREVYREHEQHSPASLLSIKGHMCTVFANLIKHTASTSRPTAAETEKARRTRLLLTYIAQNYMHPITLADLAGLTGLSEPECSRFFRQQMNQPPFSYINNYRIERSCELLAGTDMPVSEIALRTGFNSFSYYSKRFHGIMHCTPSEYRAKIQNALSYPSENTHK